MTPKRRPTAQHVLDAIVRAFYEGREPLDDGLVLVPPVYHVLLHVDAYQSLQALLPRIKQQARKRLDDELARLNIEAEAPQRRGLWRRLRQAVRRLLFADQLASPQARVAHAQHERAGEQWQIDVGVTAFAEADVSYLAVETDFDVRMPSSYKGRPTINIQRRTVVLPDGRFETVVTARRPEGAPSTMRQLPVASSHAVNTRARLSFEDRRGRHIYYMSKSEITVGRKDEEGTDVDLVLDTLPDVSRRHLMIRFDEQTDTFSIKDISRYGVTIDGKAMPAQDQWHPLPPHAELGLADVIFINFEALA